MGIFRLYSALSGVCKIAGDLKEMLKILRTFACQELDE